MKKLWITFLICMLVLTTLVWGGYSFYISSSEVKIHPEAQQKTKKIDDSFDTETLLSVEDSINEQKVDIATYHELVGDKYTYEKSDESTETANPEP